MKPRREEIAASNCDQLEIRMIGDDETREHAGEVDIKSIPSIAVFRDGKPVDAWLGVLPHKAIVGRLAAKAQLPDPIRRLG